MIRRYAVGLSVDDELPPNRLGFPPQRVLEVNHLPANRVHFRTDQGEWTVPFDAELRFPARPNHETIDWRTQPIPPTPGELAIGDILPSPKLEPPDKETLDWRAWNNEFQLVTGIGHNPENTSAYITTYSPVEHANRRWIVALDARVAFPLAKPIRGRRNFDRDTNAKFGPYRHKPRLGDPLRTRYFFLQHPTGRGRWPSGTPEFRIVERREDLDEVTMRPPGANKGDWKEFILEPGGTPHPNDYMTPDNKQLRKQRYEEWLRGGGRERRDDRDMFEN